MNIDLTINQDGFIVFVPRYLKKIVSGILNEYFIILNGSSNFIPKVPFHIKVRRLG